MNFVYIYYYKNSKFIALILKFSTIMYLHVCFSQRLSLKNFNAHIANAFKIFTIDSKIIQISRYVKISYNLAKKVCLSAVRVSH